MTACDLSGSDTASRRESDTMSSAKTQRNNKRSENAEDVLIGGVNGVLSSSPC